MIFLGVRHYFTGQSGSHGFNYDGLQRPLFENGNPCGDFREAKLLPVSDVMQAEERRLVDIGTSTVLMYPHSMAVVTSSCGTCADGNTGIITNKFETFGPTCLVEWINGATVCDADSDIDWTYWKDVSQCITVCTFPPPLLPPAKWIISPFCVLIQNVTGVDLGGGS